MKTNDVKEHSVSFLKSNNFAVAEPETPNPDFFFFFNRSIQTAT